ALPPAKSAIRPRAIRQATNPLDPPCHPRTSPDAAASTASRPAFGTTRDRPSEGRDALDMHLIWARRERKYFCKWGWTGNLAKHEVICPSGCREIRDQRVGPGFRGAPSGLRWLL